MMRLFSFYDLFSYIRTAYTCNHISLIKLNNNLNFISISSLYLIYFLKIYKQFLSVFSFLLAKKLMLVIRSDFFFLSLKLCQQGRILGLLSQNLVAANIYWSNMETPKS